MSSAPTVTILFADVCRSTQIFEQHGDLAGRAIVGNCLTHLSRVCHEQGGRVVKTIGDEIMCVLPSPEQGLRAATLMQRCVSGELELMSNNLSIRVGLHCGPVLSEGNDVYGDAVNVAARMAQLAKSQQIVTTKSTTLASGPLLECEFRGIGQLPLKGKSQPIEIVDVLWQETASPVTMVSSSTLMDSHQTWTHLRLHMGRNTVEMDANSGPVMLGRDHGNRIVLDDEWVSRIHASIEFSRGWFLLVDRSTNGTYVQPEGEVEVRLHRDELRLSTRGIISLGRMSALRESEHLLHFECKADHHVAA